MKIATVTGTRGDRPQFLAQAVKLLNEQTRQPDIRYLVDAPPESTKVDIWQRMQSGLTQAVRDKVDRLIFWEDDDYYMPTYIEHLMAVWPTDADIVGFGTVPFYHLAYRRYFYSVWPPNVRWPTIQSPVLGAKSAAGLSATAISVKPFTFFKFINTPPYDYTTDVYMWGCAQRANLNRAFLDNSMYAIIGLKHAQGWTTSTHHWRQQNYPWADPDMSWLKSHIEPRHHAFYTNGWQRKQP